jgi:hypothetical protein
MLDLKKAIVGEIEKKHSQLDKVFDDYYGLFEKNSRLLNDTVSCFKDTKSLFDVHSMGG